MIKLAAASLSDGLPGIVKSGEDAQAIVYALDRLFAKITARLPVLRQTVDLTLASDTVLDALAVEWQTPNYSTSYTTEVKRQLLLGSIAYWSAAGTVAATADAVTRIFTDARISEWFNYGGEPYYFKVSTADPSVAAEDKQAFIAAINRVKRLSAWLEAVVLILSTDPATVHIGAAMYEHDIVNLSVGE